MQERESVDPVQPGPPGKDLGACLLELQRFRVLLVAIDAEGTLELSVPNERQQ